MVAFIGELDALKHLVIEGYDHIADVHDDETITRVAYSRGHNELAKYIESIVTFEANREKLHQAVRAADLNETERMIELPDGHLYAVAKNYYGLNFTLNHFYPICLVAYPK